MKFSLMALGVIATASAEHLAKVTHNVPLALCAVGAGIACCVVAGLLPESK